MAFKKIIIVISILFLCINCKNESNNNLSIESIKKTNEKIVIEETAEDIAEKFKPKNSEITHKVIETDVWEMKKSIIVFYETQYTDSISTSEKYERQYVDAYLLIFKNNIWNKILIHRFEDDNVFTLIQSVFFANADNDKEKELIILTTCSHRLQYLYDGTEYSTWVFDNFSMKKIPKEMSFLDEISNKLYGGFEGYLDDNENSKAKLKNANDIKKELKSLGFK